MRSDGELRQVKAAVAKLKHDDDGPAATGVPSPPDPSALF